MRRLLPGLLRARDFLQMLSLESWRGLFEATGEALIVADVNALIDHLDEGVPEEIIEALEFIHAYYQDGVDTILGLLAGVEVDASYWAQRGPAADMLAELWARSRSDRQLRRVVVAAQLESAAREGTRTCHRYVAQGDRRVAWTPAVERTLKPRLADIFRAGGFTGNVTLDIQRGTSRVSLYVLRGSRLQRVLRMVDASGDTEPDDIRATRCDFVHLDLHDARLEVMPCEPRLAAEYAAAFGEALFGEAGAFRVEESFDLRALLRDGRTTLAIDGRPDVRVLLESIEWEPSPGERMAARGRDCLMTLSRELRRLGHQHVVRARFLFYFARPRRRVGVTLRPPNGIKCTREGDSAEIQGLLHTMGLLGRSHTASLWEFAGRPRAAVRWHRALGQRFAAALDSGLLTKVAFDAAPHDQYSAADGAVRQAEGLADVGIGIDDDVPPRRIAEGDLDGYLLNVATLATLLRKTLKLTLMPAVPLPDGLLEVGRREFRHGPARVFLALAPVDGAQIAPALRARAPGEQLILLAPPELKDDGTIDVVPLHDWVPPFGDLVVHFYDRLALREEMDIDELAGNARVVVRSDGVYLDRKPLHLTPQQIEFVRLVIEHPAALSAEKLGEKLRLAGAKKTDAKVIARQVKEDVAREIGRVLALDPASAEADDALILDSRRGQGYWFLVPARILSVRSDP